MKLTFEEWFEIWVSSGHWMDRGVHKGQYVMSRKNDLGSYEVGNVFIQRTEQNLSDANAGKEYSQAERDAMSLALKGKKFTASHLAALSTSNVLNKSKRCTLDGVIIYESKNELVAIHGWSKYTGARSPSFRFLSK